MRKTDLKDLNPFLSAADQEDLSALGHTTRYPVGSILFGEGEQTDFVLLLRQGHVKVTSHNTDNIIAVRGPGDTVGEMAPLDDEPRSASVYALTEVEALYIPASRWIEYLYQRPRVMHSLLRSVHARLREATRKQAEHGYIGVEQRLARGLVELVGKIGTPTEEGMAIAMSQREFAGLLGVSRESISQVVRRFRNLKAVSTGRQKIIIRDVDLLTRIAEGRSTSQL